MACGETGGLTSWAAHRIPAGTPVRYLLDPGDAPGDEGAIRLVFGAADQLELDLPLSAVPPIMAALRAASAEAGPVPYEPG